jgi:predicted nicotinamide N-methyase
MSEHASFVVAETALAAPPLVPEIRLYLASEITPLWQATEARLAETGTPPPYWAFAWPGGQAIARQLLDDPALVAGRRVLDFAAGSGLAAIAAAKAGAAAVEAAEIDPLAGAAIALNAAANGVAIAWREADLVGSDERWDVVLAGDICYERPMAERVMPWLRRLAGEGCLVLMGDPGRSYLPDRGLARLASHVVPTSRELEDRTERETVIWRVLP